MKIKDRIKEFKRVPASELAPNPHNWRTHPAAQKDAFRGLLAEIGIAGAVLAYETQAGLQLIDGHLRVEEIGSNADVPVLVLDVTEEEAKKILLTYDPISDLAGVNQEVLQQLLADVNLQSDAVQAMIDDLKKEISEPESEVAEDAGPQQVTKSIVKAGDLWILGRHRLLCGDSTDPENVQRLFGNAKKATLLSTDPPYGVDFSSQKYNPKAKAWAAIANDELKGGDLRLFVVNMLDAWFPFVHKRAAFYLWCAAMQEGAAVAEAIRASGLHIQSQIIWNKNCLVLGQADYHWKHENCWYAFWKGEKHFWYGGRDQTTVWDVSKIANQDYIHPMQKPIELYAIPIRNHTKTGDIVAEPFLGSGSQLIAAEGTNRRCFGMEISEQYCDIIIERWQSLTGEKAVKE